MMGCSAETGDATPPTATDPLETTTSPTTMSPTTSPTDPTSTTITAGDESFGVLVFHKTAGFRHASIEAGISALESLGQERGFRPTITDDSSVFSDSGLAQFEVIVFLNTTGDILDEAQQQAMEDIVRSGAGFVGIHSATDTEYEWAWYGDLVGAYFARHPAPQSARIDVVAPDHPTMTSLPATFERFDEWYDFRQRPAPGVTILATIDESTYDGGRMGAPHPIMWAQEFDGGRSFYTGFGHTEETFAEPMVVEMLGDAIDWAAGR